MTKKQIFKYSGCIRNAVVSSIFTCIGLAVTILVLYVFKDMNNTFMTIVGIVGAMTFFIAGTLTIKEIPIVSKIAKGSYKVKTCDLMEIKFRRPFAAGSDNERSLEFDKFRLTVDKYTSEKFRVGDKITMVFLNDIKYPIIIRKDDDING